MICRIQASPPARRQAQCPLCGSISCRSHGGRWTAETTPCQCRCSLGLCVDTTTPGARASGTRGRGKGGLAVARIFRGGRRREVGRAAIRVGQGMLQLTSHGAKVHGPTVAAVQRLIGIKGAVPCWRNRARGAFGRVQLVVAGAQISAPIGSRAGVPVTHHGPTGEPYTYDCAIPAPLTAGGTVAGSVARATCCLDLAPMPT